LRAKQDALSFIISSVRVPPTAAVQKTYANYPTARELEEPPRGDLSDFEASAAQSWSKGYGSVGFSIFTNLTMMVDQVSGYPVHYPAKVDGPKGVGAENIVSHLKAMSETCPKQLYALGGYGYGAIAINDGIQNLPADIISRIAATVFIGAQGTCPKEVWDRCRNYCNKGDDV
jgi:hypothetical protein